MGQKDVLLGYIEEFDSYGIKKDDIIQLQHKGIIAKILLPEKMENLCKSDAPIIGFLLGEDKSKNGDKYTISDSSLKHYRKIKKAYMNE